LIILSIQDSFADKAEDLGILTTLRSLENYQDLKPEFDCFWEGNIKAFFLAKSIMQQFDALIEASFGGIEAARVKEVIDQIAELEEDLDHQQYNLLKKIYKSAEVLPYPSFHLWLMLLKDIGSLSNAAESLGNKIRMILELKY
jgi:predicted phosphate transport protein (TIGR00153 family)